MIPPFNHNNVLPPYYGASPTSREAQSPYKCDILEFCHHFATSKERITILKGFINFRLKCFDMNIRHGFQWIDGSFMENVELSQHRSPNDIDVVTFVFGMDEDTTTLICLQFPELLDPRQSKSLYHVDHYIVEADSNPTATIESVKYWNQLFGHNRVGVWKGMLEIPLQDSNEKDNEALNFLNTL